MSVNIHHCINFYVQQDCEYDSVDIRSKTGENEFRKHGIFCGPRSPPLITSIGNSFRLEFNTDNSVQKSGFAAIFFTGKPFCPAAKQLMFENVMKFL